MLAVTRRAAIAALLRETGAVTVNEVLRERYSACGSPANTLARPPMLGHAPRFDSTLTTPPSGTIASSCAPVSNDHDRPAARRRT